MCISGGGIDVGRAGMRLCGREIPLGSRILAVCPTFDRLTGSRLRPKAAEQGAGNPDNVEELLLRKTDYSYPKPIPRRRNYRLLKNNGD